MTRTQLYLPSGHGTVGSLTEFVRDFIPVHLIEQRRTRIPIKSAPAAVAWGNDAFDSPPSVAIESRDVDLNREIQVSHSSLINGTNNIHWCNERIMASCEDMSRLLLSKKESFFKPKLGMHEIQELSYELLQQNGGDNVYCFHHSFSKYQNYFVLSASDAFKNFITQPEQMIDRAAYRFYSKFVEINPNAWVMGRADDAYEYRREMSAMMRYDASYEDLKGIAGIEDVNQGKSYNYTIKKD